MKSIQVEVFTQKLKTLKLIFNFQFNLFKQIQKLAHANFQNKKINETLLARAYLRAEDLASSSKRFSFESILKKAPDWLQREIQKHEKKRQRHFKKLNSQITILSKTGRFLPTSLLSNLKVKEFLSLAKSLEKTFETIILIPILIIALVLEKLGFCIFEKRLVTLLSKGFRLWITLICYLAVLQSLRAVDFDDLKETSPGFLGREKIYGSEKEKRYAIDGFFIEWERWPRTSPTHNSFHFFWLFNQVNYPKYQRSQLFPLYLSESSKVDERYEANHLLLSNYAKEKDGSYSYRLFPFFWLGGGKGKSSHGLVPLYYKSSSETKSGKEDLLVMPFYYGASSSKGADADSLHISPFFYSEETKSSNVTTSRFFAPILPLYYSYSDDTKIQRNYLGFIDTEKDKKTDSISRVWILPVFYWREKSYLNVFPLFYRDIAEDEKSGAWYGLAPPVYYSYSPTHSTFYILNYFTTTKQNSEKTESFTTLAPLFFHSSNSKGYTETLIPALYYSETAEDKSTHKNIALLYDHTFDKNDKLDRLFISPFLFYKKDNYLNIFPFYFSSLTKSDEYRDWYGFIPPIYYSRSPTQNTFYILNYYSSTTIQKNKSENFTTLAPIYFRWSDTKGYEETLVPFFYYSKTKEDSSSYSNVFLIYSQVKDNGGKLSQILVSPIFFYKRDSYFNIAPFYWSWNTNTYNSKTKKTEENERLLALPLFYHEKNADRSSYTNILGLFSREYDGKGNLAGSMFAPFYFYKKDTYEIIFPFLFKKGMDDTKEQGNQIGLFYYNDWNSEEETFLAGNFYSYKNKKEDSYFRTIFPVYYEWKNEKSSGELTPFYLTLDFPNKDRFHLNLSGYSYNLSVGAIESEKKPAKTYRYVDTDYSWLGYAFRISTRTTFDFFEDSEKETVADNTNISPKLSQRKSFNRENTKHFYGVNILFGLYGWEEGDTKRHVRLLPFAWFTWDTKSDDKVYTLPPFLVSYSSDDLKYTVIFPIYGHQKDKEVERTSVALIGYMDESKKENNLKEKTILWPLVNWYSSDTKNGSRFIPIYWYRESKEDIGVVTNLVTPIFYHNHTKEKNGNTTANTYSPFWFRFYSEDREQILAQHFTLPIYYFRESIIKQEKSQLFLSLPYSSFTVNEVTSNKPLQKKVVIFPSYYSKDYAKSQVDTETVKFYSPLYVYNSEENASTKQNDFSWLLPIPMLYHSYESKTERTYWNWLAFADYEDSKTLNHARFFPIYNHNLDKENGKVTRVSRWILPTYYEKNFAKTSKDTETVKFYSPLYVYNSEENASTKQNDFRWLLPIPMLYHSYESKTERTYWNWLAFAGYEDSRTLNHARFFPIYNHSVDKENGKVTRVSRWILPTYYEKNFAKTSKDTETTRFYSPLYVYNSEENASTKQNDFSWLLPIPMLYHSYESKTERTYWNWLAFAGYEDSKTLNHARFFPIYNHNLDKENGKITRVSRWILPTYYEKNFAKSQTDTETVKFYSPLYVYNSEENASTKQNDFSWLLPIPMLYHSYESKTERTYWNWLAFAGYEDSKTLNHARFFPIYNHNLDKENGKVTRVSRWILPTYYEKNFAKTSKDTETVKFYSPLYVYNSEENASTKQNDFCWLLPIPMLYHSYESKTERAYWNWLAFAGYEDSRTLNHARFFPIYNHHLDKENGKITRVSRWILPTYYEKNFAKTSKDTESVKFYSPLYVYNSEENASTKQNDFSWLLPIPMLYHSYESANDRSYWNWLAFAGYEDSKTLNHARFFPIYNHNLDKANGKITRVSRWILPTYYEKNFAKTSKDTETVKFYSPLYVYNSEENASTKQNDFSWLLPIPMLYHSYESTNDRTYWNWLAFAGYEDSKTLNHARFFPIYNHNLDKENGKVTRVSRWILPTYYEKNLAKTSKDTESVKFYSPLYVYNSEENASTKQNDFSWLLPIPMLYHSYESKTERTYWNWLAFAGYEDSKTLNHARFFPIYNHNLDKENGKITSVSRWILPTYYEKNFAKTSKDTETTRFYSPLYVYNSEENASTKQNDFSWLLPIPMLYHSYESKTERTYWNWLAFAGYEDSKTLNHARFFPIYNHNLDKENGKVTRVSRWILPTYYEKNFAKTSKDTESVKFYSPLYVYNSEENASTKQNDFSWLLPIPMLYHSYESKTERTYWNWLAFTQYEDSKDKTSVLIFPMSYLKENGIVKRFTIFPYWYSKNTEVANRSVEYKHLFPVYFSKEDNKDYSALLGGLYINSNPNMSMQNFLLLAEHEYKKDTEERKVDLLLRTVHIEKKKDEFKLKLFYGVGGVEKSPNVTDVHLLWIEHENKKDSIYNNFLPVYYNKNTGGEKKTWFTPTLSYFKKDNKEELELAGLGSLYYKKEDLEKKEEHVNLLMGILYYKTSVPKERGYKGQGSLWGLLWEYNTESDTKYSKFSVLKFVYSKTTDETGESYQRIMGVRL